MSEIVAPGGIGKGLTAKQKRAISALLLHGTVTAAAKVAGMSARQIHRWLAEPEFSSALQTASDDALAATVRKLKNASNGAVGTLEQIHQDPEATNADRSRAATALLSHVLRLTELAEIERRLIALEQNQNANH